MQKIIKEVIMDNNIGITTNGKETINPRDASLMPIIKAVREKIDLLKQNVALKKKMVHTIESYSNQFLKDVKEAIEFNEDEVRQRANVNIQTLMNSISTASDQQIDASLQKKSELNTLKTEVQIQEEVLKTARRKEDKCLEELELILEQVTKRLADMKNEYPID